MAPSRGQLSAVFTGPQGDGTHIPGFVLLPFLRCRCWLQDYPSELRRFAFTCPILSSVFKGECFRREGFCFEEVLEEKPVSQVRLKKISSRAALFNCRE